MYAGDWLVRLTELVRGAKNPRHWHVPANVWGLGVTSLLTDVSSEMVLSVLPAYLVLAGGLAPLTLGVAAGVHEGGQMLAAWGGGLTADRVHARVDACHRQILHRQSSGVKACARSRQRITRGASRVAVRRRVHAV